MAASKIVDTNEVLRWFEEGRTYAWMSEQYRTKYNIETTLSMWSNFRNRHGLDRRITRDDALIPWAVAEEHRYDYPILMLRREARRRDGRPLSPDFAREVDGWIRSMAERGEVLDYDPVSGWRYATRRPDIDTDLIREPDQLTGRRAWR